MRKRLSLVIDTELSILLEGYEAREGLSASAIARMALRRFFGASSGPRDDGFREGFLAGKAEALRRIYLGLADGSESDPAPDDPR